MKTTSIHRQQGFVSLFSVIFFMLFITVITIGFLRVMSVEQRQALDSDLSASALASAQSGVEDAKRAILKYYSLDPADPLYAPFKSALTNNNCNSLHSSPAVVGALGLDSTGANNIVSNAQINQNYSCLSVSLNSPDYISQSSPGVSDFVPLRTTNAGGFNEIKVSWHLLSASVGAEGDGIPAVYSADGKLPTVGSWSSQNMPSFLRVQLYGYPKSNFNSARLADLSHSFLLIPARSTTPNTVSSTTVINFGVNDPRGYDQTKNIARPITCQSPPLASKIGSYTCTATLGLPTGGGFDSNSNNYFMRITPIYGQSHFKLALQNNGTAVDLDGVQPIIDVTGKSEDVYRRLQTRIKVNANNVTLPEFSVESADTICKNMQIADNTAYQANNCP